MRTSRARAEPTLTVAEFITAIGRAIYPDRELPRFAAPRTALNEIDNLGRQVRRFAAENAQLREDVTEKDRLITLLRAQLEGGTA